MATGDTWISLPRLCTEVKGKAALLCQPPDIFIRLSLTDVLWYGVVRPSVSPPIHIFNMSYNNSSLISRIFLKF